MVATTSRTGAGPSGPCVRTVLFLKPLSDQFTPNGARPAVIDPGILANGQRNNVRFGSKADMCGAKRYVRFTRESDIKWTYRMSALGQKRTSAPKLCASNLQP